MSNIKISQLPVSSELNGGEELPLVQGGVTKKTTAQDIANLASANITTASNGGVEFNIDGDLQTIYNTTVDDNLSSAEIKYQDGTSLASMMASEWKQLTIVQVLDKILFPLQLPVYQIPTISFSTSTSPLIVEVGSNVSPINLQGSGIKKDAGVYDSFKFYKSVNSGSETLLDTVTPGSTSATALLNQFGQPNSNNPQYNYTSNYADTAYNGTNASGFPIPTSTNPSTTVTYSLTGQYEDGNPLLKSNGVIDSRSAAVRQTDAPQLHSETYAPSNTITFTGYYPVYYGKSTSSTPPTPSEIAAAILAGGTSGITVYKLTGINPSGTISIPYVNENVAKCLWFAHYQYNTEKTKWYQSATNRGDIGVGLFASPITQAITSQQGNWTGKNFKVYITTYPTATYVSGAGSTLTYEMRNT
jgi:hypothetical protein